MKLNFWGQLSVVEPALFKRLFYPKYWELLNKTHIQSDSLDEFYRLVGESRNVVFMLSFEGQVRSGEFLGKSDLI